MWQNDEFDILWKSKFKNNKNMRHYIWSKLKFWKRASSSHACLRLWLKSFFVVKLTSLKSPILKRRIIFFSSLFRIILNLLETKNSCLDFVLGKVLMMKFSTTTFSKIQLDLPKDHWKIKPLQMSLLNWRKAGESLLSSFSRKKKNGRYVNFHVLEMPRRVVLI